MAFDDNVLLFAPRGAITPAELDDLAAIDPARPFRTLIEAIEAGGFKNKAGALTDRVEWSELRRRLSLPR